MPYKGWNACSSALSALTGHAFLERRTGSCGIKSRIRTWKMKKLLTRNGKMPSAENLCPLSTCRTGIPNSFPNMSGRSPVAYGNRCFSQAKELTEKALPNCNSPSLMCWPEIGSAPCPNRTRNFHRCDGRYTRSTPMLKSYRRASSASCLYRRAFRPANRRFARAAYTPLNENACATIGRSLSERR
jgi:hypothetical protein